MTQLDIEIMRYEDKLLNAVKRNLPESIIQQYNKFLGQKLSKKQQIRKISNKKSIVL